VGVQAVAALLRGDERFQAGPMVSTSVERILSRNLFASSNRVVSVGV